MQRCDMPLACAKNGSCIDGIFVMYRYNFGDQLARVTPSIMYNVRLTCFHLHETVLEVKNPHAMAKVG